MRGRFDRGVARICVIAFFGLQYLLAATVAWGANCEITSVGLIPINDLGTGTYQGVQGGLYPGGVNTRPTSHELAGMAEAALVTPINSEGAFAPGIGKIVILSIGMSNTRDETFQLRDLVKHDPWRAPAVMVVNGAKGGRTAEKIADLNDSFWRGVDDSLEASGVSGDQVQVIWFKEVNKNPDEPFAEYAESLHVQFKRIMKIIRLRYTNARLCYCSSRIYAGYASTSLSPEPYAYESGFPVKWLIEDQINGDPDLNYDPELGPVRSPWLSWGEYLWADGLVPRSDGLFWECSDMRDDGTHPSVQGATKVAQLLLEHFRTDPTTATWYLASPTGIESYASVPSSRIDVRSFPNPFNPQTTISFALPTTSRATLTVYNVTGGLVRTLILADRYPAGEHSVVWNGRDDAGKAVSSGIYLSRLTTDLLEATTQMVLIR